MIDKTLATTYTNCSLNGRQYKNLGIKLVLFLLAGGAIGCALWPLFLCTSLLQSLLWLTANTTIHPCSYGGCESSWCLQGVLCHSILIFIGLGQLHLCTLCRPKKAAVCVSQDRYSLVLACLNISHVSASFEATKDFQPGHVACETSQDRTRVSICHHTTLASQMVTQWSYTSRYGRVFLVGVECPPPP